MLNRNRVVGLVLIAVLLLAAAPAVLGAFSPEVFAIDQPLIDNTVNITRATVGEAGWVAVRAMVERTRVHQVMDELFELGGRAILVTDIHACRL